LAVGPGRWVRAARAGRRRSAGPRIRCQGRMTVPRTEDDNLNADIERPGRMISRALRGRKSAVFAAILPVLLGAACRAGRAREARIEWADLPAAIVEPAEDLRTGYLVVPERRFPEPSRRTIRLPFIVMRSRSAAPSPDPVLITAGGPGGSTLAGARRRERNPLLEDRDVILFEQRGTRFAVPALLAPAVEEALRSGWGVRLNGDPGPAAVEKALADTLGEYRAGGIDLAGYTTRESAADIAALRTLLGLDSWNLYGASYSTKVMLTVLRDSPRGVRSVVLDSVLPLEANWDEDAPANIYRVLTRVLAAALEDEALRPRIEGLEDRLKAALLEADRSPAAVEVRVPADGRPFLVRLNAAGVMNCIYAGLEDADVIRRLPLIIEAFCRGETRPLAPLAESYLGSSQGFAWGMRLAVWCNEEFPFERLDRISRPSGLPYWLEGFVQAAVPLEAWDVWPRGRPEAAENTQVRSDVPALIAAGEFDPDTPVEWARATAARFPNSQLVEFAGLSHVPLFRHPEAIRIIREFLADPRHEVDPGRTRIRPPFMTRFDERGD
jgi:pimeloyl-ACP methyl ester carboxylesterase